MEVELILTHIGSPVHELGTSRSHTTRTLRLLQYLGVILQLGQLNDT